MKIKEEQKKEITRLLDFYPKEWTLLERRVLVHLWGLKDKKEYTLKEISEVYNTTYQNIQHILNKAQEKIKLGLKQEQQNRVHNYENTKKQ